MSATSTTDRENRVIDLAEQMVEAKSQGYGFRIMDTTSTRWDLTHVSPHIRQLLQDAADLADLTVEIYKVGDDARVRFV